MASTAARRRGSGASRSRARGLAAVATPPSIERALRRVRLLTAALVVVRLLGGETAEVISWPWILAIGAGFGALNVVSWIAQRNTGRSARMLGVVQLCCDMVLVLIVLWLRTDESTSVDWALLVWPVLEGAIRFQHAGALASWAVLGAGYAGWNHLNDEPIPYSSLLQRMVVVVLVALPTAFLAQHLVQEMRSHQRGREEAERRGALLRAAALGGRRSTSLDVDEILTVLRETIGQMGFADPLVFEIDGPTGTPSLLARPVRHSKDVLAVPPGDPRLLAAAAARDANGVAVWPPEGAAPGDARGAGRATARYSVLVAALVASDEEGVVVVTGRWPSPGAPPASQCESVELFAAQAGAALRNAQTHSELEALKDRLAYEASHDVLTDLPNRRRFHEELERVCGRGRPGDLVGVLFLDLDGFKDVNDRYGHDRADDLLVQVAKRLRNCVRPGDVVARMGGDEFTVMLTRIESPAPAVEVAERVCSMLTEPFELGRARVTVSTSIGIALGPADTADPGDLVRRADVAMYRAKSQGKAGWAMDPGSLEPVADPAGDGPRRL